jgi:hypothetical protein
VIGDTMKIEDSVADIASQMGMIEPNVELVDGKLLGCFDSSLLTMSSRGERVGLILNNKEIQMNLCDCPHIEVKIRKELLRLQKLFK